MERVAVNGVELEYEIRGSGDPVLLIHGSHICGSFIPLMDQHALTDDYALIRYHRRGFAGSSPAIGPVSVVEQASDARALLERLGVGPAHVVGHSYGGPIALQLAADSPESVRSLALLEAALLTVPGGEQVRQLVEAAGKLYRDGEWEAAEDLFLGSPKERADITRSVPGGLDQALRDVDTYFSVEAPAHDDWSFGPAEAGRVRCPVLFMLGAESSQLYREACDQIREWVPQTETVVLPGASHLLHIQQPAGAAALLAEFFDAHARGVAVRPRRSDPATPARDRHPDRYNATVDLLDRHLEGDRGDNVAVVTADGPWTYAAVAEAANRAGNGLRQLGVDVEHRVLMVMVDSPEFAAVFFGAIKLGAVPVPVNTNLRADEYAALIEHSRARCVVVSASVADVVRRAAKQARHVRALVVVGDAEREEVAYSEMVRAASPELAPADTTRDDAAFWLYTSGTAGRPKAVVHAQHAMRACVDAYGAGVLRLNESDVVFSVSKLYFAYGLGALYFSFAAGAAAVLTPEPPQPRTVLHTVSRFRPSVVFGVPTSYASILGARPASWKGEELASVRLCVAAGEALPERLWHRWKEATGLEIVEGIGSTEACHIFISNRPGEAQPGWTGTLVDGWRARIVDEAGREVPPGEAGTLHVSGPSTFSFYWRDRETTRDALAGHWLDTGDVFVRDDDGRFSFRGRLDDMLKVSGIWVSPIEIEAVLAEHDAVADCAVVGIRDAINLVRLVAFVVPREGQPSTDAELDALLRPHVRQRLGGHKTPRRFVAVDELPRTETGKLLRAKLRERTGVLSAGDGPE